MLIKKLYEERTQKGDKWYYESLCAYFELYGKINFNREIQSFVIDTEAKVESSILWDKLKVKEHYLTSQDLYQILKAKVPTFLKVINLPSTLKSPNISRVECSCGHVVDIEQGDDSMGIEPGCGNPQQWKHPVVCSQCSVSWTDEQGEGNEIFTFKPSFEEFLIPGLHALLALNEAPSEDFAIDSIAYSNGVLPKATYGLSEDTNIKETYSISEGDISVLKKEIENFTIAVPGFLKRDAQITFAELQDHAEQLRLHYSVISATNTLEMRKDASSLGLFGWSGAYTDGELYELSLESDSRGFDCSYEELMKGLQTMCDEAFSTLTSTEKETEVHPLNSAPNDERKWILMPSSVGAADVFKDVTMLSDNDDVLQLNFKVLQDDTCLTFLFKREENALSLIACSRYESALDFVDNMLSKWSYMGAEITWADLIKLKDENPKAISLSAKQRESILLTLSHLCGINTDEEIHGFLANVSEKLLPSSRHKVANFLDVNEDVDPQVLLIASAILDPINIPMLYINNVERISGEDQQIVQSYLLNQVMDRFIAGHSPSYIANKQVSYWLEPDATQYNNLQQIEKETIIATCESMLASKARMSANAITLEDIETITERIKEYNLMLQKERELVAQTKKEINKEMDKDEKLKKQAIIDAKVPENISQDRVPAAPMGCELFSSQLRNVQANFGIYTSASSAIMVDINSLKQTSLISHVQVSSGRTLTLNQLMENPELGIYGYKLIPHDIVQHLLDIDQVRTQVEQALEVNKLVLRSDGVNCSILIDSDYTTGAYRYKLF